MSHFRRNLFNELRLSQMEMESSHYLDLTSLLALMPDSEKYAKIVSDHTAIFMFAKGSSHNHQAWEGGYLDHVVETMNIACQLYQTLDSARKLPFKLHEALEVMFLHDLEKPFKDHQDAPTPLGVSWKQYCDDAEDAFWEERKEQVKKEQPLHFHHPGIDRKAIRRQFRTDVIEKLGILLADEQWNALKYVEGVPDSEYTPGERTMGGLAAFCHCCDMLSARLWHDKGHDVRGGSISWE